MLSRTQLTAQSSALTLQDTLEVARALSMLRDAMQSLRGEVNVIAAQLALLQRCVIALEAHRDGLGVKSLPK